MSSSPAEPTTGAQSDILRLLEVVMKDRNRGGRCGLLALGFVIIAFISCTESGEVPSGAAEPGGMEGMESGGAAEGPWEQQGSDPPLDRDAVGRRLPDLSRGGSGYCIPHEPVVVDVASWIQTSDDFIVGTVEGFTPVWEPLWRLGSTRGFLDPADCLEGRPGLDVHLTDLVSLIGNEVPETLTVRIGVGALFLWGNSAVAEVGSDVFEGWSYDSDSERPRVPPLAIGMRLGGALHQHAAINAPVFLPTREPLFEVLHGRAWFQRDRRGEEGCGAPWPDTEPLDGLTVQELEQALRLAVRAERAPLASEHRAWLQVDEPARETGYFQTDYSAACYQRAGEVFPEERPTDCETDADCWEGDVCIGGCTPEFGGEDVPAPIPG
jgi:hypothetical protein